jgi:acetolactate synthase-1/2/3 large subunit
MTSSAATPAPVPAGVAGARVLRAHDVDVMFTLNGGHIWPFYEAARDRGMRVVDTRHEQSAAFAAEAYAKLTRCPGLAALTAGPGAECKLEPPVLSRRISLCLLFHHAQDACWMA